MNLQIIFVTISSIFTKNTHQVHKILSSSKHDASFTGKALKVKPEDK